MALGNVERGEIAPVVLDLGPGRDREAEIGENLGKLVHHLADRMDAALRRGAAGRVMSSVSVASLLLDRRRLQRRLARRDRLGHRLAQGVDSRPLALPLLRRHAAKRLQQAGDRALLAERGDALRLERGRSAAAVDPAEPLALHAVRGRCPSAALKEKGGG